MKFGELPKYRVNLPKNEVPQKNRIYVKFTIYSKIPLVNHNPIIVLYSLLYSAIKHLFLNNVLHYVDKLSYKHSAWEDDRHIATIWVVIALIFSYQFITRSSFGPDQILVLDSHFRVNLLQFFEKNTDNMTGETRLQNTSDGWACLCWRKFSLWNEQLLLRRAVHYEIHTYSSRTLL